MCRSARRDRMRTGNRQDEIEQHAAIERQVLNRLRLDDFSQTRILRFQGFGKALTSRVSCLPPAKDQVRPIFWPTSSLTDERGRQIRPFERRRNSRRETD